MIATIRPTTASAMPMIANSLWDMKMPTMPSTIAAMPNRPPRKIPATGMTLISSAAPPKTSARIEIVLDGPWPRHRPFGRRGRAGRRRVIRRRFRRSEGGA